VSRHWLLVALVATPVPALAVGVVVMRSAGLPTILWSQNVAAAVLAAYVLCIVLAASVGNYPVPVMGYGAAPILGYYVGATEFVKGSRLPDAA